MPILTRGGALVALSFALLPISAQSQAPAQPPAQTEAQKAAEQFKPLQMDRNGVLILVRSTLLAVQQANETGNYSVLRELGSPGFQQGNSSAKLSEIFANLRNQNVDLSGVAVLEPQLTRLPEVNGNGFMRMAGFFPSVPVQVNFDLVFASVAGRWRLFGIAINLGQSSPVPPAPAPEAAATPAAPATRPATPARPKTP
ncbi:hypothetical protein [Microvirga antarctica]|uniref:hypothetical protein n=1 Tax=Microvirga antarctica TaxID=2819233 RepID=UPI001B315014|nr:hypothetical protein [Microvirga antarctica]